MSTAEGDDQSKKPLKPLFWMASSKDDLRMFAEDVKDVMGFAHHQAQELHQQWRSSQEKRE